MGAGKRRRVVKRCIVTGGTRGVGAALCLALARRGHAVFLTGRNRELAQRVVEQIASAGGRASYGIGDVCLEGDVARLSGEAAQWFGPGSPCDVLVTSAGVSRFGAIQDLSEQDFETTFQVNVKGTWLWARQILPGMKEQQSGQILFVSAAAGVKSLAECSAFGASKWAIQGIAGSLREECRGGGIKIATLCPGAVSSAWRHDLEKAGKPQPPLSQDVLLAKMLTPQDVAAAAMSVIEQCKASDMQTIVLETAETPPEPLPP